MPALVFPFTLVYNTDELAALETCVTIMMWWGHSWHATHPNPPVHIIDALDTLLKYHDSKLYAHLKAIKVAPGVLGWAMMSNLFTEVLSRTNWLKLMDCLICHFDQIAIILLAPIAIMKELKSVLLTCDTAPQVTLLLRSQQNVNMATVIRVMLEWLRHTPPKYFSSVATRHLDGTLLFYYTKATHLDAQTTMNLFEACFALFYIVQSFMKQTCTILYTLLKVMLLLAVVYVLFLFLFSGKRLELGPGHTTEELRLSEVDEASENLALTFGRPIFPIAKGIVPAVLCNVLLVFQNVLPNIAALQLRCIWWCDFPLSANNVTRMSIKVLVALMNCSVLSRRPIPRIRRFPRAGAGPADPRA